MRTTILLSILALLPALLQAQPAYTDPGGVLHQLTVARFGGSGTQSIQAMTSDAKGNVYVTGTTSSFDFPTKNAAQPTIGESVLMRSLDRGATWQKVNAPPAVPISVTPHPRDPQTLLVGALDGIYMTSDGGNTWRHVYSLVPLAFAGLGGVFNIASIRQTRRLCTCTCWGTHRLRSSWRAPMVGNPGNRGSCRHLS